MELEWHGATNLQAAKKLFVLFYVAMHLYFRFNKLQLFVWNINTPLWINSWYFARVRNKASASRTRQK